MRTIATVVLLALVLVSLLACGLLPRRSADLEGTSWILSSLAGDLPLADTTVTLEFGEDGTAFGSDGCNRFSTTYAQRRDSLTFEQPMASTMMACAEPVMEQATAYMAVLAATTSFSGGARELVLMDGDDEILATFVILSQDLAGTAWDVISYNNGREAVVGVLLGSQITASFADDGMVSGNAGCNRYFASYAVDGKAIEIGPAGTTRMACADPAGVMEQESQYLAALESAATYSIQGNMLEMRTADDAIAVVMARSTGAQPEPMPPVEAPTAAPPPTSAPGTAPAAPTAPPLTAPTETPLPEIAFWADETTIDAGQCTTVRWSVNNVQAVWVYPKGANYEDFPRAGQGSEQVCLVTTTTFEMRVLQRDGSTVFREVTVNVTAPPPTATSAPAVDPLAGTSWQVVSYNNGRGAVVSVLADSLLLIDFEADGLVTGNAGCNTYSAAYTVNGNTIAIGLPGTTNLFCAAPEGVMDQEAAFLAALQSAATFRIRGDTLEMRTAGDAIAVSAVRVP
jgi:heat shock protein HslJ